MIPDRGSHHPVSTGMALQMLSGALPTQAYGNRKLPRLLFLERVTDLAHDTVQVNRFFNAFEMSAQHALRPKLAALVERPDLVAIVGGQQFRGKLTEVIGQVRYIPQQH